MGENIVLQIVDIVSNDIDENGEKVYMIKIYGRTDTEKSICVNISGFHPYFYILIQNELDADEIINELSKKYGKMHEKLLESYEIEYKYELYGFHNKKKFPFLKFIFKNMYGFYIYRKCLREKGYITYETDLASCIFLKYIHLKNIQTSGWIQLKNYSIIKNGDSNCNIECNVYYQDVYPIKRNDIARLIIASFDIECTSDDGSFPQYNRIEDKIIQIGITVHKYGENECFEHHILTLGNCEKINRNEINAKKVITYQCKDEKQLVIYFGKVIKEIDPDIITGYNIWGFDFEYIYKRAKKGNGGVLFDYSYELFKELSRSKSKPAEYIEKPLESLGLGQNYLKMINMEGRVIIDLYKLVQRDYKLRSYKLDAVAEEFLKMNKIDLPPSKIFKNFKNGKPSDIKEIAVYCLKDCELVNKLIIKLNVISNNIGMSNVCLVPLSYLFVRGQGIKIFSLVSKECLIENYCIRDYIPDNDDDSGYEGAIVFPPTPGIYYDPVGVCDFNSLYPSSMIAENISHDSIYWTKIYDNDGKLIKILNGENKSNFNFIEKNFDEYEKNLIEYDNFEKYDENKHSKIDPIFYIYKNKIVEKVKTGKTVCCFMVPKNGEKNILPRILQKLLTQRKLTRIKAEFKNIKLKDGKEYIGSYSIKTFKINDKIFDIKNIQEIKKEKLLIIGDNKIIATFDKKSNVYEDINKNKYFEKDINSIYTIIVDNTENEYIGIYKELTGELIDENGNKFILNCDEIVEIKDTYDPFTKDIFDGLQLAFKLTANSLYGQLGAKSSKIFYKQLAACTTATGRKMVTIAKDTILTNFSGSKLVYGDTDSVFINYMGYIESKHGTNLSEEDKLKYTFKYGKEAGKLVSSLLKKPQNLAWEKAFYPFIIFAKKRYVGNKYQSDNYENLNAFKQSGTGIVLKRRDNAPIVNIIYSGIIDKILNERNIDAAKSYFKNELVRLLNGEYPLKNMIISKTLKGDYANPNAQAHKVLAERIGERDPGNKPLVNERIAFCYFNPESIKCSVCYLNKLNVNNCKCIRCFKYFCEKHINVNEHKCDAKCYFCKQINELSQCKTCLAFYCPNDFAKHKRKKNKLGIVTFDKCKKHISGKLLQGDFVEHPDYIKDNNLLIDYKYYLERQIAKPCLQIFSLTMEKPETLIEAAYRKYNNHRNDNMPKISFYVKGGRMKNKNFIREDFKIDETLFKNEEKYLIEIKDE